MENVPNKFFMERWYMGGVASHDAQVATDAEMRESLGAPALTPWTSSKVTQEPSGDESKLDLIPCVESNL